MFRYTTRDPATLAAAHQVIVDHHRYAEDFEIMRIAVDLPKGTTFRQAAYGDLVRLTGICTPDWADRGVLPAGWRPKRDDELQGEPVDGARTLVPDLDNPDGRRAQVIMASMGPVPTLRGLLAETGMPSGLIVDVGEGDGPRTYAPSVTFADTLQEGKSLEVQWPIDLAPLGFPEGDTWAAA